MGSPLGHDLKRFRRGPERTEHSIALHWRRPQSLAHLRGFDNQLGFERFSVARVFRSDDAARAQKALWASSRNVTDRRGARLCRLTDSWRNTDNNYKTKRHLSD